MTAWDGFGAHRLGVPWWDAETPPEGHKCWVQSSFPDCGVNRCACGAYQLSHHGNSWGQRNSKLFPQDIYVATGEPYEPPPTSNDWIVFESQGGLPMWVSIVIVFVAALLVTSLVLAAVYR